MNNLRMKYFPGSGGVNQEQAAVMSEALAKEFEMGTTPTGMITAKNRVYEFFMKSAQKKNLNPITAMSSLGLNYQKSIQFFKGEDRHVEFLRLLHAVTLLGFEVNISFESSDFPFGKIEIIE